MEQDRRILWFQRAQELSRALVEEPDPKHLLPKILDSAIELSGAERGFLVRIRANEPGAPVDLGIEVARGFGGIDLDAGGDPVSRSVVEEVLRRGEGIVTTRESDKDLLSKTTVMQRRVLAILCVPMRLHGETVGAIYLDNRFQPDAFHESALGGLCLFADQSALAINSFELRAEQGRANLQLAQAKDELSARDAVEGRRRRLKAVQRGGRADKQTGLGALRGSSETSLRLYAAVERAARSQEPVAIVGEIGSGKSAVAGELHRLGNSVVPAQRLLCVQLQPDGLSALEQSGTCLLEELGELPPETQAALLARLEQGPLGARLLSTSRAPLAELVQAGRLRPELSYRLDVLRVEVPPLRERSEDVPLLLDAFSEAAGRRLELTPAALQQLADYAWPGNLHELAALARRLLALDKKITRADLPSEVAATQVSPAAAPNTLASMERRMVAEALEACGGNKAEVARRLGIQRSTLYRLPDRHGLR
ncbi:MAG: sigma-54-dependent Fis family transcriptional regulator [Planctomycetes bacterium]|nr:sigma-54-dependent Fis family transcriptional regulator [Planctomycetota bacterium]